MTICLQSKAPEKTGDKENPKRDIRRFALPTPLQGEVDKTSLVNWQPMGGVKVAGE